MKYAIEFNPEFYLDLKESFEWYNSLNEGIASRFLDTVKNAL